MSNNESYAIHPHRVNAGGIFIAALKGALQPIGSVILVPVFLLAPSFGAALLYHVFKRQNFKIFNLKKGLLKSLNLKSALLNELTYLLCVLGIFHLATYKIDEYAKVYVEKASKHQVLQIATPEQLEYAQNIKELIYFCSMFLFVLITLIIINSITRCAEKDNNTIVRQKITAVFKIFSVNLVPYIVFFVLMSFVFSFLEVYFARYKLMYIQSLVLEQDVFNPTLIFMIFRVYLLHIIFFAVSLCAYSGCGLAEKITLKMGK